ncbi:MAG: response regulator [Bacteroidia bacterium]|nr:response regulator [Bacteroidia bacterium]
MDFLKPASTRRFPLALLCTFLCFSFAPLQAQIWTEAQIDSIRAQLPNVRDTQLVHSYIYLGTSLHVPEKEAEEYVTKGYAIADSLNFSYGKMKCSYLLGSLYHYYREYEQAVAFYKRGLASALEEGWDDHILRGYDYIPNTFYYLNQIDSSLFYNELYRQQAQKMNDSVLVAVAHAKDGDYFSKLSLIDLSLKAYMKSSRLSEGLRDTAEVVRSFGDIALMLSKKGEREDALIYFRKAISIGKLSSNPFTQIPSLINCSILFRKENQLDSASFYLSEGERIIAENDFKGKVDKYLYELYKLTIDVNQANVQVFQGNYQQALKDCEQIFVLHKDRIDQGRRGNIHIIQTRAYIGLKNFDKAREFGEKAMEISQSRGSTESTLEMKQLLSEIAFAQQKYTEAFEIQNSYIQMKDSLDEAENKKAYKALLLEYETENKEREIAELRNESLQDELRRNFLIGGVIFLALLALGVFFFFRIRAKQSKELLEQGRELDRMKSRFFTQLSHELRTPLTLILGPLNQLLESIKGPEDVSKLSLMKRNANRLLQLVNQVMDLSKIQAGKLELQAAPLQVNPLIKYIFTSFSSKAEVKELDYQLILPEDEVELYLDADKFQQILGNLLSNGCKFVPEKGKLHVKVEDRQDKVLIRVEDNGPGISPLQQTHIFDPYFQADTASQVEDAGSGIGLALCKELVELHGGKIEIESKVGEGTAFSLHFLKGKEHLQEDQINYVRSRKELDENQIFLEKAASLASLGTVPAPSEDNTLPLILIAEDVKDMQEYLHNILFQHFRLMIASNGKEALELAQKETPDLVISDIMMPKMDGLAFIQELKADSRTDHIPVIFLTAKASAEDRLEGWKHEAHAFLTKPFNANELLLVVNSVVRSQQKMQVRFQGEVILKPSEVAVSSQEAKFLNDLTELLEARLDDSELSVEIVANEMALSRSQLHRKLKALTGQSPTEFIKQFRLQRAKQLLEQGYGNMSDVCYAVGISSPSYFSKIFMEAFGVSPSQWPEKA